jgi:L-cysteine/cystine lyase
MSEEWTRLLQRAREGLPAVQTCHYFNTGTYGPHPAAFTETLIAESRRDGREGRTRPGAWPEQESVRRALRDRVGTIIGAPAGTVALTHRTTDGLNLALMGRDWAAGDEVVVGPGEHLAGLAALTLLKARYGVSIVKVSALPQLAGNDMAARLEAAFTKRTRMVLTSHVSYDTGIVVDLKTLAAAAHAQDVLLVVDGAQAAGAVPIDVTAMEVDYYALPAQKWLLGPEGQGAVYVRPSLLANTWPLALGAMSVAEVPTGDIQIRRDARRFEVGGMFVPGLKAFLAGLEWVEAEVGWTRAIAEVGRRAAAVRTLLTNRSKVQVITPAVASPSGIVTFQVPGRRPEDLVEDAARHRIVVRSVPSGVRLSAGWYLDATDLEALDCWLAEIDG